MEGHYRHFVSESIDPRNISRQISWPVRSGPAYKPGAVVDADSAAAVMVCGIAYDRKMSVGERFAAEWEDLRLVVQEQEEHRQTFVYDFKNCEVLYTARRFTIEAAKLAALDFATAHKFGSGHDLNLRTLAAMLLWDSY